MIRSMASKTQASKRTGRSEGRAGWHHIGADITPEMYAQLRTAAAKDSVPYSVIIRWALADYFVSLEASK